MIKIQIGYVFLVTTNDALKRYFLSLRKGCYQVNQCSCMFLFSLPLPTSHSKSKPSKYFSLAKLIRKYSSKSVHKLFSYFTLCISCLAPKPSQVLRFSSVSSKNFTHFLSHWNSKIIPVRVFNKLSTKQECQCADFVLAVPLQID